jgi:hypothetical protein
MERGGGTLKATIYLRNGLVMMLRRAGFDDIEVEGGRQHAHRGN